MRKKLYRSRDRYIFGLCGGLGEYFDLDPNIIRIAFIIFGCTGFGILAYFVSSAIIPNRDINN